MLQVLIDTVHSFHIHHGCVVIPQFRVNLCDLYPAQPQAFFSRFGIHDVCGDNAIPGADPEVMEMSPTLSIATSGSGSSAFAFFSFLTVAPLKLPGDAVSDVIYFYSFCFP